MFNTTRFNENKMGPARAPQAVLALCAVLTLVGCGSTQVQDDEAIDALIAGHTTFTPQNWASSVDQTELERAQQVDWLASFQDSRLINLVNQALANNRDLMAAAANVEIANAIAIQAGAQTKPQADLAFASSRDGSPSDSVSSESTQAVSLQVNWEVDLWGRISAGQRAAVASAEAAAADYKYAQHSLAAGTAKAYFIAIEAGLQADVLRESIASLEETSRIVDVQYESGLVSAMDASLTRSDLAATREQLITLEASQREALRALEVLLGEYPEGDIAINMALPALPPMPPLGVPSEILERRPDLVASERQVAAAFSSVNQAKAAQLPRLSLTSSIGGASNSLSDITDPGNVAWQLASNLLAPIFDGGTRAAQVDIETAEQTQALAAYAQTALNAFSEVETNLDLADTLVQRESELGLSLTEAEKAYRIAELRYEEGEIGLIDVLTIQQRVLSANSNKLSVQRLALDQRINLFLALGGDWKS